MLKIKRIYEKPDKNDGIRVLVDRLWPRGLRKDKARINKWMKEIAPSDALRKWFGHKTVRWEEFKKHYYRELKSKKDLLKDLKNLLKKSKVTLLYAAQDKERNNAKALLEFLQK